jgi:hypothetical protein
MKTLEAIFGGLVAAAGITAALVVFGFSALYRANACSGRCNGTWLISLDILAAVGVALGIAAAVGVARSNRSGTAAALCSVLVWAGIAAIWADH